MPKLILILPLFLLGCSPGTGPTPGPDAPPPEPTPTPSPTPTPVPTPTPTVSTDAGPPAPVNDDCAKGEQQLLKLGCKDSRGRLLGGPNMHGEPWSQICRDNKANGVDMKPLCIAAKASCAEVEACR